MCLCMYKCVRPVFVWPACNKGQVGNVFEAHVCEIFYIVFCFDEYIALKDSGDWFCVKVPAIESNPNLHTGIPTAAFYWRNLKSKNVYEMW